MWMMSGPLCDWMDAVMRGCRSLALMNSNCTSAPSSREASPACFFSSTSQAGMKSTQRRTCSLLPCANAGARPAAVSPTTAPLPCKNRRRVMPARMVMALALVVLLELGLGPLHGVLGPHALHGLGVHVDDDVLRVRLGGLRRRRSLVAEHPRLARGAPEDLQRLVDLGPHRMLFPGLRGAHRIALVHLEPLPVVLLLVHPGQEALGELRVLAVLHHRVLEGHVERGLAGRPRRQRRRVLDILPERLALRLELSDRLAPAVQRLADCGPAALRVPRAPPGDGVAAGAVRHGQPPTAELAGGVARVVEAALRPGVRLPDVGRVDETVGI